MVKCSWNLRKDLWAVEEKKSTHALFMRKKHSYSARCDVWHGKVKFIENVNFQFCEELMSVFVV